MSLIYSRLKERFDLTTRNEITVSERLLLEMPILGDFSGLAFAVHPAVKLMSH